MLRELPVQICILNKNLTVFDYTDAFLHAFHIKNTPIIGSSFFDVFPHENTFLKDDIRSILEGEKIIKRKTKHVSEDGTVVWLKWKIKLSNEKQQNIILSIENITKQIHQESVLLKAQEVAVIGGWEIDLRTSKLYWTNVTKQIHEVPMNYNPVLETGINFYKEGYDRETIQALVKNAIEKNEPWDTELKLVTAKNNEIWVRAIGEPEFFDGKCVRLFGTFQDIDKEKKIDIEYKRATNKLQLATEAAKMGIWEYSIQNENIHFDDQMLAFFEMERKAFELDPTLTNTRIHPNDIDLINKAFEDAVSGKKDIQLEYRIVFEDNRIKYLKADSITKYDKNNNPVSVIGTNYDITPLIETKNNLKMSESAFSGAFENSAVGMSILSNKGILLNINSIFAKNLGYKKKELVGKHLSEITHPEDLNADLQLIKTLKENTKNFSKEKRYICKNGEVMYGVVAISPIEELDGSVHHFIGQIIDITPRVTIEKKLKTLLNLTNQQNKGLFNFAHIVSHNLRSHASNLSMLADFLVKEDKPSERKQISKLIKDSTDSLNETVIHLNEVVQVKSDVADKMIPVNLCETLKRVSKGASADISKYDVKITTDIDENEVLNAVPAYAESIFLNLLTNSIKYKHPDRNPEIHISATKINKKLLIRFEDNGLGINLNKHRSKIFGMYKTFHKHKESKGIGLFITKNQIEAMAGSIEVESEVNVGTTFTMIFKTS